MHPSLRCLMKDLVELLNQCDSFLPCSPWILAVKILLLWAVTKGEEQLLWRCKGVFPGAASQDARVALPCF